MASQRKFTEECLICGGEITDPGFDEIGPPGKQILVQICEEGHETFAIYTLLTVVETL